MKIGTRCFAIIFLILVMFSLNAVVANENITSDNGNDVISMPSDSIQMPDSSDLADECLASVDNAASEKISSNNGGNISETNGNSHLTAQVNGGNFSDIQSVIDSAQSGETIFLNGQYYNGTGAITIDRNIIIDGSSSSNGNSVSTLDALNLSRIFYSKDIYNITLRNLVLENAFFNGNGWFAFFAGGNITLENIVIRNQKITNKGFVNAFYIGNNSTLSASNITFANNTIISSRAISGILFNVREFSNVTIENLNFHNNNISTTRGAITAANLIGRNSNVRLNNINFYQNNISSSGALNGGIAYVNTKSNLDASNIRFYENSFYSRNALRGSIVYMALNATAKMKNVVVNDNYLNSSTSMTGGVINIESNSSSTLKDLEFNNNNLTTLSKVFGGFIRLNVWSNSTLDNLSFKGNSVNSSSTIRGGFFLSGANSTSNVSGIDVKSNVVVGNGTVVGGFLFESQSNRTINGFNFEDNYVESLSNYTTAGLAVYGSGEVILSRFNITNLYFRNNRAVSPYTSRNITDPHDQAGGGLFKAAGIGVISNAECIDNFVSKAFGGCVQILPVSLDYPVIVENCRFINTTLGAADIDLDRFHAHDHGGVICVNDNTNGSGIIRNCTFIDNCNSLGGAICPHNHCIIEGCRFINNTATKFYGGAISTNLDYFKQNETTNASITIIDCYFEGNKAPIGGAIQALGDEIHIYGCTFVNNSAVKGGAVFLQGNTIDVHNSTFTDNFATDDLPGVISGVQHWLIDDWLIEGGAIHILGSDAHLFNNTFRYNIAYGNESTGQGGAIYVHGDYANISDSHFDDNFAYGGNGSAIFIYGLYNRIENSEFFNHSSSRGTLYIKGNYSNVTNSKFEHNNASLGGGAIYIEGDHAIIDTVYFNDNNATIHGGALHTHGDYVKIINSEFYYNNAIPHPDDIEQGLGGAIFIRGNHNWVGQSIFDGNTARNGSAIYNRGQDLHIDDDKFIENQAFSYLLITVATPQISYYTGSNEVLINVTLVGGDNIINAIYHDDSPLTIFFHNVTYEHSTGMRTTTDSELHPADGVEKSQGGTVIYQDPREDFQNVTLLIVKEKQSNSGILTANAVNGDVILNSSFKTGLYGNVTLLVNDNLSVGTYSVYSEHPEDRLYKQISNSTTFRINPQADLGITKDASNNNPVKDEIITWTIKVTNYGPNDAVNASVSDLLPNGLEYISDDSNGKYDNGTGRWFIGDLANGKSVVLKIKTRVLVSDAVIVNVANVTSDTYDNNTDNNEDDDKIKVRPSADVSIVKKVNANNVSIDDVIVWTVIVTNNGPDTAYDVVVSEKLPSGLKLLSYKSSKGSYKNGVWTIGTLENGSSVTLDLTTRVTISKGVIKNLVFVTTSSYDPNETNNKNESSVNVNSQADLAIVKQANVKKVRIGDTIIWTITVTNNGPNRAVNVIVTDRIISGSVEFISAKASKGYFNPSTFIWLIDDLEVGETAVLQLVCKALSSGIIINYVNVTSDADDPNMDNNEDNATVEVIDEPSEPIGLSNKVKLETLPATGNPILIVILALFSIIIVSLKRKD